MSDFDKLLQFARSIGWQTVRSTGVTTLFKHSVTGETTLVSTSSDPRALKNSRSRLIKLAKEYDEVSTPFPFVRSETAFYAVPKYALPHYRDADMWAMRAILSKTPVNLILMNGKTVSGRITVSLFNDKLKMPVAGLLSEGKLHYFIPQRCDIPYDTIAGQVPTIRVLSETADEPETT